MKRATRTLTLWTTSIRWTLITNRIFERSISNITFQNNLSKQSLWETLTYSVYTIYIASSPRICYLHFLFSNKSRYFSRFHVETTERSRGSQEGEKKWESSRRFDTVEKKNKREREKNPSNVRKTIVRSKNARRLSIRYLGEDCFQEDEAFSVGGKFRGSRFTSGFLFLASMDHVPTYARFNVRAKPTDRLAFPRISVPIESQSTTVRILANPLPSSLDRSDPRNHRCFTHEERARHVTAALLLLLNSQRIISERITVGKERRERGGMDKKLESFASRWKQRFNIKYDLELSTDDIK